MADAGVLRLREKPSRVTEVVFPKGVKGDQARTAFAGAGKGRHAPFCFRFDSYVNRHHERTVQLVISSRPRSG